MDYTQITVTTTSEGSELVAMVLYDAGSEGVSISDDKDIIELIEKQLNWDYIDEKLLNNRQEIVLVSGFFPVDIKLGGIYQELESLKENSQINVGSLEIRVTKIKSDDWENEWRKYYSPIKLGKVTIIPAWQRAIDDKSINVYVEPGMAFGTGNHETTSMCIELMQEIDISKKMVLDVGCGSGILGITASKLGARKVVMTDLDEQAVKASIENVALNGVQDRCEILQGDLNCGDEPSEIVLANITADVLIRLKQQLRSVLKNNGYLILSGIIHQRLNEVENAYNDGFALIKKKRNGEWNALLYQKRS